MPNADPLSPSALVDRLSVQLDDPSRLAAELVEWLPRPLAYRLVEALERPDVAARARAARLSQEQTTSVPGVTSTPAAETRGNLDEIARTPLSVPCPVCQAIAGQPCIDGRSPKVPRKHTHAERKATA